MTAYFEEPKTVRAYDVDLNNRIKISSLLNLLQDVASVHADQLGLGFKHLYNHNLGWVLSWLKLDVIDYAALGEDVVIRTWPRCKYKLYSLRDYIINSADGNELIRATSAWLPINTKTKRITDTKNLPQEIKYYPELIALDGLPQNIISGTTKEILLNKKFRYTDIDINQHVNNTRYIELILDCYSPEHHRKKVIKSFSVSFSSESFFGDDIEISRSSKNGFDIVEGINTKSSKQTFISEIGWSEKTI